MRWPFSRGRDRRHSQSTDSAPAGLPIAQEKQFDPNFPSNATPRPPPRSPEESSLRKRRRSPEIPLELEKELSEPPERIRRPRSRGSVDDLTALPGARRLERSPHLRKSTVHRAAVPYNSSAVPASRLAAMAATPSEDLGVNKGRSTSTSTSQKRTLSKRQEIKNRALREEEIRAMSAPMAIPKRISGQGDMLNRENKKARRTLSAKHTDDQRGSAVSLPFQESIHSSMSGVSDKRGWEIPGLGLLSPRPTVRLSGSLPHSASFNEASVSRNSSKRDKEKLPMVSEGIKKRDRRRVADLADDLDAADLRVLLERDSRRRDRKKLSDKEKLEKKLLRRVERARREEQERPPVPTPPTAVHPALRNSPPLETSSSYGQAPLTPTSDSEAIKKQKKAAALSDERHDSAAIKQSPFRDPSPSPSPFADPYRLQDRPPPSELPTPASVAEDPILGTARELRYSQGRLSQVSTSPATSPVRDPYDRTLSPLRTEYTPDVPQPVSDRPARHSSSSATRKPGTWASIFRRGGSTRTPEQSPPPPPPQAGTSFSNTSRDSMSKQPLPAHLTGTSARRRSGTPARTQSIFREDLPESPMSVPGSRVASPDVIAAGNYAAARRSKRGTTTSAQGHHTMPELSTPARSESPVDNDGRNSTLAMSASLASIDSEGSWLTGRPSKRKSHQSHVRSSVGSGNKREGDNQSYENLSVADDEYVRRLTPSPEDDHETPGEMPPTVSEKDDDGLLRRNTSRRRPNLVLRDDTAKSAQGLVAHIQEGDTPPQLSPDSVAGTESENDQVHDPDWQEQQRVIYGRGHARQISSGSAKLLDIKARSGRSTPDARMSMVSNAESAKSPTALSPQSPFPPPGAGKL